MKKRTVAWYKLSARLTAAVGIMWMGIGLRDIFAPHLFRFDGQVATNTVVVVNFVIGTLLLLAAFSFHRAKSRDLPGKS